MHGSAPLLASRAKLAGGGHSAHREIVSPFKEIWGRARPWKRTFEEATAAGCRYADSLQDLGHWHYFFDREGQTIGKISALLPPRLSCERVSPLCEPAPKVLFPVSSLCSRLANGQTCILHLPFSNFPISRSRFSISGSRVRQISGRGHFRIHVLSLDLCFWFSFGTSDCFPESW